MNLNFGLITETDAQTLLKTLNLVCNQFAGSPVIRTLEIGIHNGDTSRAIRDYLKYKNVLAEHTHIDNQHDLKMGAPFKDSRFIIGNSIEVYNQIKNESQHFIFLDACHNYPMTMADFLCYSNKVITGGYFAFHDTSPHIPYFRDYQGMGDKKDSDMFIACRKAVGKLGLLDNRFHGWELVFDEYDTTSQTGGVLVVKKMEI